MKPSHLQGPWVTVTELELEPDLSIPKAVLFYHGMQTRWSERENV